MSGTVDDIPEAGGVAIRSATPDDAPAIADVLAAAFEEFRPAYTPAGYAATTPDALTVRARFDEGPAWVALDARTVIGTVAAVQREAELYVRSMAVVPEARGRGAAGLLLDAVERHARATGVRRLRLSTTPFLDGAIRLYSAAGFRFTPDPPHDLHGTPLRTMVKHLDADARDR
jgi:ribosomal protein S18 acetylase RimI-like enzyme